MAGRCGGRFIKDFVEHSPACERCAEAAASDGKAQCTVCGLAMEGQHLDEHMRLHTGERPFRCAVCLEAFARKDLLVWHIRRHTNERPYACRRCERTFHQAAGLRHHQSVHSTEQPFACPDCAKRFKRSYDLKTHQRRAHGYHYACRRCSAKFSTRRELMEHHVQHSNAFRHGPPETT